MKRLLIFRIIMVLLFCLHVLTGRATIHMWIHLMESSGTNAFRSIGSYLWTTPEEKSKTFGGNTIISDHTHALSNLTPKEFINLHPETPETLLLTVWKSRKTSATMNISFTHIILVGQMVLLFVSATFYFLRRWILLHIDTRLGPLIQKLRNVFTIMSAVNFKVQKKNSICFERLRFTKVSHRFSIIWLSQ